ncbi:MAG: hypothetical protein AAF098_07385 [Pseudomonadota bacterium]
MTKPFPKVLIYGAGRHGQEAAWIAHDLGWDVVGAYNRAGDKVGQDIGEVRDGKTPIGVVVEDCEKVDFSKLDVDLAFVAMTDRLANNIQAYERLLGAGINVICHGAESYFPRHSNSEVAARIDEIARANGVTFTGTGVWDHSRIWAGILAAGPCKTITSMTHKSRTQINTNPYIALVGTGVSVEEFERDFALKPGPLGGIYQIIPALVMDGLGFTISSVTERREPVVFARALYCEGLGRDVPAGECAGLRFVVEVNTVEGPKAHARIELRLFEEHEGNDNMGWEIDGDPNSDVLMARHDSLRTSTMCMINRAADVITAPPGIQMITQLGPQKTCAAHAVSRIPEVLP